VNSPTITNSRLSAQHSVESPEQQTLGTAARLSQCPERFQYEVELIEQVFGALRGKLITVVRRQAAKRTKAEGTVLSPEAKLNEVDINMQRTRAEEPMHASRYVRARSVACCPWGSEYLGKVSTNRSHHMDRLPRQWRSQPQI
jgi:hypothetical protein